MREARTRGEGQKGRDMESQSMLVRAELVDDAADRSAPGDTKDVEQRRARRHATSAQIGLMLVGEREDFCRIRNISPTGFMAQVYRTLSVGDEVRVETKSGQGLHGIVVWTADHVPDLASRAVYHIGVQFAEPVDITPIISPQFTTHDGAFQRWPRLRIESHLRLILESGRQYSGSLCDISQGGAKFQTSHPLGGETTGLLVIRGLPTLRGSVRWVSGTRIGVSFDRTIGLDMLVDWIEDRRAEASASRPTPPTPH